MTDVPEELPRLEGRNGDVWREHVINGRTQEAVAQEYGITQQRVSQIVAEVRRTIPDTVREELVQDSLEHLRALQGEAMRVLAMAAAPVTAGKDGLVLIDPETGTVVRDHAGRLNALKAALAVNESIRRMVGLDAAKGLDVSVTGAEDSAARLLAEDAARRVAGQDT